MFREPVNRNNITKGTLGDAIAEMVRSREQGEAAHRNGGGGGGTGPAKKKIDTTHAPKMRRGDKDHDNVRQRRSGPSRAETNASRGERWSKSSPLSLSSSPSQTQAEGNRREEGGAEISAPTPRFQRFGRPGGGGGVAASEIFRDRDQVHRSRRDGDASGKRDGGRASGKNFDDVHADWGGRSDVHEWLKENVVVNSGTAASMLEREPRISQQRHVLLFTKTLLHTVLFLVNGVPLTCSSFECCALQVYPILLCTKQDRKPQLLKKFESAQQQPRPY